MDACPLLGPIFFNFIFEKKIAKIIGWHPKLWVGTPCLGKFLNPPLHSVSAL